MAHGSLLPTATAVGTNISRCQANTTKPVSAITPPVSVYKAQFSHSKPTFRPQEWSDLIMDNLLFTKASTLSCLPGFHERSQNCEKRLLSSSCPSVCPSAWRKLGSHCTRFHQIWHFSTFRQSVDRIQGSFKCNKNNRHFTWRRFHIYDSTSLSSSQNEKCFTQKLYRKSKHTFYVKYLFSGGEWAGNRIPMGAEIVRISPEDLGPTQPPIQWVPGLFPWEKAAVAWR